MATQTATSVPSKRLAVSILSTDSSFKLNNILTWDGLVDGSTSLTSASFGTRAFGVFRNATNSQMELFEWDPTTVASASITIIARGLSYSGGTTGAAVASYSWNANETIVELGSHTPQLFEQYADKSSSETIAGVKTFSSSPVVPTGGTGTQAANATDIANAVSGASGTATNLVNGTLKLSVAALSAPSPIAVGDNDGRITTPVKTIRITRDSTTASGAVTTAHGLGRTPTLVKATAYWVGTGGYSLSCFGQYDGTNNTSIYFYLTAGPALASDHSTSSILVCAQESGKSQVAVATVDGTNITLTWTKNSTPTVLIEIILEAY